MTTTTTEPPALSQHGMWPGGERPSKWPNTDPDRNVRDAYDATPAVPAPRTATGKR